MPTEKPLTGNMRADGEALDRDAYERAGGYRALRKALQSMTPEAVTEEVKDPRTCEAAAAQDSPRG